MIICPKCHNVMTHIYRFTPEKNCELDICKTCYYETKPKLLKYDGIEIMQDNTEKKRSKDSPRPKPSKKKRKGKKR